MALSRSVNEGQRISKRQPGLASVLCTEWALNGSQGDCGSRETDAQVHLSIVLLNIFTLAPAFEKQWKQPFRKKSNNN